MKIGDEVKVEGKKATVLLINNRYKVQPWWKLMSNITSEPANCMVQFMHDKRVTWVDVKDVTPT